MVVGKWPPPTLRAVALSSVLVARMTARTKWFLIFAIFKNSRTFNVVDVFLTSLYALFLQNCKFFYRTVCYHTRDKQIGLPLRGRPILLSLL